MAESEKLSPLFLIAKIDRELKSNVTLCVFGSFIPIFGGMYKRDTDNINVWSPLTEIENREDFLSACLGSGIFIEGISKHPENPRNIELRFSDESSENIDFGEIEKNKLVTLFKGTHLKLMCLPYENLIISKLSRAKVEDVADSAFLIRKYAQGQFDILRNKARTLKKEQNIKKVQHYLAMFHTIGLFESSVLKDDFFLITEVGKESEEEKRKLRQKRMIKIMKGIDLEIIGEARNRYSDVVNYLLTKKDPAELLIEGNVILLRDLIQFIRQGLPDHVTALSDPFQYKVLRNRITELVLRGWF